MNKIIDHRWYMLMMVFFVGCFSLSQERVEVNISPEIPTSPYLIVLGVAQDAGYPQMNCSKTCCRPAWEDPDLVRFPTCLGLVDPAQGKSWMFEATPEIKWQWQALKETSGTEISGIFLTHAHIGHYTGLIHLGREVMGTKNMPVYAMPKMQDFLEQNGPWDQLVKLNNIEIMPIQADSAAMLGQLKIEPLKVPHRDEYSETVGFRIYGPNKTILFIPDIDKWSKWSKNLVEQLAQVDLALIDGSFFQDGELPNRNMAEIPHPFVVESIAVLENLPAIEKNKVYFIHLNHTNPLLHKNSRESQYLKEIGMHVARQGQILSI